MTATSRKKLTVRIDRIAEMRLDALVEMTGASKTAIISTAIGEMYESTRRLLEDVRKPDTES